MKQKQQHCPSPPSPPSPPLTQQQPRDPPSISFEVDPLVHSIICKKDQFGIVLVAGWPPKPSFIESYSNFINDVKQCFDPKDVVLFSDDDDDYDCDDVAVMGRNKTDAERDVDDEIVIPNVYLYPPQQIHITIATFHPFHKALENADENSDNNNNSNNSNNQQKEFSKTCQQIVQSAKKRNDWPKQSFPLRVKNAQIGKRAGILLYEDMNHMVDTMRKILLEEYKVVKMKLISSGSSSCWKFPQEKELIIPNIIHSTFLRFGGKPITNGELIQERFQNNVQSRIINHYFFQKEIVIDSCQLVVEKKAYMHIPCDVNHVLDTSM